MSYSVVKGTSYVLVQAPDMILHNGTTQTTEKFLNPNSEYLKDLPKSIRSYEDAVNYLPNQVYIGNKKPADFNNSFSYSVFLNSSITFSNSGSHQATSSSFLNQVIWRLANW